MRLKYFVYFNAILPFWWGLQRSLNILFITLAYMEKSQKKLRILSFSFLCQAKFYICFCKEARATAKHSFLCFGDQESNENKKQNVKLKVLMRTACLSDEMLPVVDLQYQLEPFKFSFHKISCLTEMTYSRDTDEDFEEDLNLKLDLLWVHRLMHGSNM